MTCRLHTRVVLCFTLGVLGMSVMSACGARAAEPAAAEPGAEVVALAELEARVAVADPRDRCFAYTDLLHRWTELAGRELAAGNDAGATAAMLHAEADTVQLRSALRDNSRRLKNAEQLLAGTVHRLTDILRASPLAEHDAAQAVLLHVSSAHDELLAAVFAH